MRVAVSWSAGKDSCLSLHRALRRSLQVSSLLNMVNSDAGRSMSHGLKPGLIASQAEALGLPIVQRETDWETYEPNFKQAVSELKRTGIQGMVFGDMDIRGHKEWVERICGELGVTAFEPLWGNSPQVLLAEFLDAGFEAVVVCAKAEVLGDEWLGRPLNEESVSELARLSREAGIHLSGEQGEYHTFVTDGPIFKKRIEIADYRHVVRQGYRFLDITGYRMEDK